MAKQKDVKLEDNSKVSMFEYSEMASQMIEQRKKEFSNLQHNYLLATMALKNTQEQIANERVAFEQLKKAEEKRREDILVKKERDMDEKAHALEVNVRTFEKRSADLKAREIAVAHLFEDRNKLNEERIDVERLRNKAEDAMRQANKKSSEASALMNTSRVKEDEAKALMAKVDAMNVNLATREAQQKKQTDEIINRIKELNALKEIVDPKIKELELVDAGIKEKEAELAQREKDVARKLEEDRAIVIAFSEREKKLKAREIEVSTREQEVTRKLLLMKGSEK